MITALIILILFIVFFGTILKILDFVLPIAGVIGLLWLMKETLHLPF